MRGFRLIRPPACGTEASVRRSRAHVFSVRGACSGPVESGRRVSGRRSPITVSSSGDYMLPCTKVLASGVSISVSRGLRSIRQVPTMKSSSSSDFMRRNRKLENRYIKYMIGLRCIVRFRHVFLQGMPEWIGRSRRDSDRSPQPESSEPRGGARSGSLAFGLAVCSVPGRGNRRRAFRSGVALRWTNGENVIPLPP